MRDNHPIIRPACSEDVQRISALCTQLGYPTNNEDVDVINRFSSILQNNTHIIYVATLKNNFLVGWIHAHKVDLIILPAQVLIFGLVVDKHYRRNGIGNLLVKEVEDWAIANNSQAVRLRSNIIREDAHKFYTSIGYKNTKHSLEFSKELT